MCCFWAIAKGTQVVQLIEITTKNKEIIIFQVLTEVK